MNTFNYLFLSTLIITSSSLNAMKRDRADFANQQARTLFERAPRLLIILDEYATKLGHVTCYTCFNEDDRFEATRLCATKTVNYEKTVAYHAGDMNHNEVIFNPEETFNLFRALETKYNQQEALKDKRKSLFKKAHN